MGRGDWGGVYESPDTVGGQVRHGLTPSTFPRGRTSPSQSDTEVYHLGIVNLVFLLQSKLAHLQYPRVLQVWRGDVFCEGTLSDWFEVGDIEGWSRVVVAW